MTALRTCTIVLIAALLTCIGGTARARDLELIRVSETERVYRVTVNPNVEPFGVRMIYDNPVSRVVTEMRVYRGDELLQTLPVEMEEKPYIDSKYMETTDINDDGFIDISVLVWWRPAGNEGWSYWLYVPEKDLFEYNEQLTSIDALGFDKNGRIVSYTDGGAGGGVYSYRLYEWRGTELVLVVDVEQDFDEETGKCHKVAYERRDGKMVVVSDRMLDCFEAEEEAWDEY